jgi:hypothetical protein
MVADPSSSYVTTNAAGSFNVFSTGFVQGMALDNPSSRQYLRAGVLAPTETLPMWGGVAISAAIIPGGKTTPPLPNGQLGAQIIRATTVTTAATGQVTGFSVSDQNYASTNSPASPVPLAYSGGQVNYYRFGSGARVPVKLDPNLVDLEGKVVTTQVSWDFVNQMLVPYTTATISSGTYPSATTVTAGTYTSATGATSLTTGAAHGLLPGDTFAISAMVGTGSIASLNGTWVATTGTTGSTLNFTAATGLTLTITSGALGSVGVTMTTSAAHGLLPGDTFEIGSPVGTGFSQLAGEQTATAGTTGTTLNFVAASGLSPITITSAAITTGGILPIQSIEEVSLSNNMTVVYNSTTGAATWNRNDAVAIIVL